MVRGLNYALGMAVGRLDLWKSNGFDITTFKLAFGITDI